MESGQKMEFIEDYGPFLKGDIVFVYDEHVTNAYGNRQYLCVDKFNEVRCVAPTALKPVTTSSKDNVNSPAHYSLNHKGIECIDAMEAMLSVEEFIGYLRGNIFKYLWRFKYKNGKEDIDKARWYFNKLKEVLSNNPSYYKKEE